MQYKKSSWKDKIDPAFDNFIKTIVKALDLMELPSNFEIANLLEKTKKANINSFKSFYEGKNEKNINIFDLSSISKVKQIGKALKEIEKSKIANDIRSIYKTLTGLANDLPEKSKSYYYKAFEPISSDKSEKEFESSRTKEAQMKWFKEFQADMIALFLHKFIHSLADSDLQKEKETLTRMLDIEQVLFFSFDLLNRISILTNKKSLKTLYTEAKNGNQESLIRLLKIDKTLFDHDWVRELMLEAMITGDDVFFEKIGQAIKSEPPLGKFKWGKVKYILLLLWNMGLYRLTKPELLNLLEDGGLEIHEEPESFYKFVNREIKPLFK